MNEIRELKGSMTVDNTMVVMQTDLVSNLDNPEERSRHELRLNQPGKETN